MSFHMHLFFFLQILQKWRFSVCAFHFAHMTTVAFLMSFFPSILYIQNPFLISCSCNIAEFCFYFFPTDSD